MRVLFLYCVAEYASQPSTQRCTAEGCLYSLTRVFVCTALWLWTTFLTLRSESPVQDPALDWTLVASVGWDSCLSALCTAHQFYLTAVFHAWVHVYYFVTHIYGYGDIFSTITTPKTSHDFHNSLNMRRLELKGNCVAASLFTDSILHIRQWKTSVGLWD